MSPQLYAIQKQIVAFLSKHHAVMFIAVIGLILSGGILYMYNVIQPAFSEPDIAVSSIKEFDKVTIEKIKNLRDSNSTNSGVDLACPRIGVFSEGKIPCINWFSLQIAFYKDVNKDIPKSADTLCTFVKSYLDGPDCTTTSDVNLTDDKKPYTIKYHYVPKATNEIGYWDGYKCSSDSKDGIAETADKGHYSLLGFQAGQPLTCVDG